MKTSQKGVGLIIDFEGFRSEAYLCPAGVPTIGIGFTKNVRMGDKMTLSEAKARLSKELIEYERGVMDALTVQPTQPEFDACVSLSFNIGVAGFRRSSVAKAHNRGDKQAASRAFGLWNKAGGKVWPGLTRRRAAEAALYLTPVAGEPLLDGPLQDMPQQIDPETSMSASPINRASVVAGGTATVAAVTQTLQAVNQVKAEVDTMGNWLVPALLVAVVGLCAYVIVQRLRQRDGGWA
jgi:lysozyme